MKKRLGRRRWGSLRNRGLSLHGCPTIALSDSSPARFQIGAGLPNTTCWDVAKSNTCIQHCSATI